MNKRWKTAIAAVAVGLLALLAYVYASRAMRQDACLDGGGAWLGGRCIGGRSSAPVPDWLVKLIASQPRTVVEEATYMGKRVFEVTPGDRAPDSGNEHVVHAEDGRVICEFGGYAGQVASGSCDPNKIEFVRTIYPAKSR